MTLIVCFYDFSSSSQYLRMFLASVINMLMNIFLMKKATPAKKKAKISSNLMVFALTNTNSQLMSLSLNILCCLQLLVFIKIQMLLSLYINTFDDCEPWQTVKDEKFSECHESSCSSYTSNRNLIYY